MVRKVWKVWSAVAGSAVIFQGCNAAGGGTMPAMPSETGASATSATSATGVLEGSRAADLAAKNQYAAAYKKATWGSAATVSFAGSCSMTLKTTGVPPYHSDYYLAPVSAEYPKPVAVTPVSHTKMSLVPYTPSSITAQAVTVNVCPSKASQTTAANQGAIGYMISGEALFNPYEGDGDDTPAMSDNVSYTFTKSGVKQTASFIDSCNSHPTPLTAGYNWHHHGVPTCLVAQIDGKSGPSHLIGFALDGFPIYGGRNVDGKVISVSQLDACNGITSPTPEFPKGAYHYVLPIGVTGKRSSLNCYSGTVSRQQMAISARRACSMTSAPQVAEAATEPRRVQ